MSRALIIGAGGIGSALANELKARQPDAEISLTWTHNTPPAVAKGVKITRLDPLNESDVKSLLEDQGDLDIILNAVGMLHHEDRGPEKSLSQIDRDFFIRNIEVNTLPTLYLAKYAKKNLKHNRSSIFATISAKVGSIEDNGLGGWYSYRCSKAALNMALKNIAVEWSRTNKKVCVAALHPGTTDTALSLPFQKNVPPEKLFSPAKTAGLLWDVIETLEPELTGRFWSWDGSELPW